MYTSNALIQFCKKQIITQELEWLPQPLPGLVALLSSPLPVPPPPTTPQDHSRGSWEDGSEGFIFVCF